MAQLEISGNPIASPVVESDVWVIPLLSYSSKNFPRILGRVLDGTAFLSHDFGVTWRKVSSISDASFIAINDSPSGEISIMDQSGYTLHVSFDQGLTFKQFRLPKKNVISDPGTFSLSRNHPDWLIITEQDRRRVHYTNDSGNTWRSHGPEKAAYFNFVEGGQFVKNLVYGGRFNDDKVSSPGKNYATSNYDKIYTQDLFNESSWKLVEGIPYRCIVNRIGDVLTANDVYSGELAVSYDGVNFHKVESPKNLATGSTNFKLTADQTNIDFFQYENSILLLESRATKENLIREWETTLFSNVLILEKNSVEPKLLLENVRTYIFAEFRCIEPKMGVFIANVVCNPEESKASKEKLTAKTVISSDGGSTWGPLAGPNGGELQLNIDFNSDFYLDDISFGGAASLTPAPGILVAYGNEAEHLFMDDARSNSYAAKFSQAYLTRDAGRTWIQIDRNRQTSTDVTQGNPRTARKGFIVGANGRVILERPHPENVVDYVLYTVDDGNTWKKYELGFSDKILFIEADTCGTTNSFLLRLQGKKKKRYLTLTF